MIPGYYRAPHYYCARCTAACVCSEPATYYSAAYTARSPDLILEPFPAPVKARRDRPWYRDKETPRRREWWKR